MAAADRLLTRKHGRTDDDKMVDDDSTEFKIAILQSMHPGTDQSTLLELLVEADGSVEDATRRLEAAAANGSKRSRLRFPAACGLQVGFVQRDFESREALKT